MTSTILSSNGNSQPLHLEQLIYDSRSKESPNILKFKRDLETFIARYPPRGFGFLKSIIKSCEDHKFLEPLRDTYIGDDIKYKVELTKFNNNVEQYADNRRQLFGIIYDHLSADLINLLKQDADFDAIVDEDDPLKLWKLILMKIMVPVGEKEKVSSILRTKYTNLIQTRNMSDSEYREQKEFAWLVLKESGNTGISERNFVEDFIQNLDPFRHGKFLDWLDNEEAKGTPIKRDTIIDAYKILTEFSGDGPSKSRTDVIRGKASTASSPEIESTYTTHARRNKKEKTKGVTVTAVTVSLIINPEMVLPAALILLLLLLQLLLLLHLHQIRRICENLHFLAESISAENIITRDSMISSSK